jgi:hypothetical protein
MDYKELFRLVENLNFDDFREVRKKIEKIIENNPKITLQEAKTQVESFKNLKNEQHNRHNKNIQEN